MQKSESIKEISKALLLAQSEMGNAIKQSENPFFKSSYADLNSVREACLPLLNKYGITAIQPIIHLDGKNFVETILLHESGEFISSLTEIIYSKEKDAQSQGSGITYARRYGLQSLVNIGSEDDDGNKASQPVQKEQKFQDEQEDKITTWLSEKEYKAIIAFLKSTKPEEVERGRKGYDKFMTPPFGMKKTYRDEIQLIIKDLDREKQKRIENKSFDN